MKRAIGIGVGAAAALLSIMLPSTAEAKRKPREVWSVTRTTDPITGDQSCVVTAFDTAAGMKFSRMGFLYPVVENNSKLGLLVAFRLLNEVRLPRAEELAVSKAQLQAEVDALLLN